MSRVLRIILSLFFVTVFLFSFSSCNKEGDVCFTCTKIGVKAQSDPNDPTNPTTIDFCDTESKAYDSKLDYEAQGYVCSEK